MTIYESQMLLSFLRDVLFVAFCHALSLVGFLITTIAIPIATLFGNALSIGPYSTAARRYTDHYHSYWDVDHYNRLSVTYKGNSS